MSQLLWAFRPGGAAAGTAVELLAPVGRRHGRIALSVARGFSTWDDRAPHLSVPLVKWTSHNAPGSGACVEPLASRLFVLCEFCALRTCCSTAHRAGQRHGSCRHAPPQHSHDARYRISRTSVRSCAGTGPKQALAGANTGAWGSHWQQQRRWSSGTPAPLGKAPAGDRDAPASAADAADGAPAAAGGGGASNSAAPAWLRKLGWDPESLQVDANYSRWRILPAAMCNHLCLGR